MTSLEASNDLKDRIPLFPKGFNLPSASFVY